MSIENICTILISVLSAAITAYFTARSSAKNYAKNNNKEDVKKAIELAQLYEKDLLPLMNAVNTVYRNIPELQVFSERLNHERQMSQLKFTESEMKSIFNAKELEIILEHIDIENIPQDLLHNSRTAISRNYLNDSMFLSSLKTKGEKKEEFDSMFDKQLRLEFSYVRGRLLNILESFSMYFSNAIADESIVYQSLHQTFIGVVLLLYFDIAKINTDPKDTFFINIIELFNIWNDRYKDKKMQEAEATERVRDQLTEKPTPYK